MNGNGTLPIAARVREQRLRLGWRQADVAGRAALARVSYARFEAGGRITLDRLLRVAAVLGLSLEVGLSTDGAVVPNPAVVRQRGVRQRPTSPPAKEPAADAPEPPARVPPVSKPPVQREPAAPPARPAVDGAAVAAAAKQYELPIRMLVGVIVMNRLNNYTAAPSVQNVMRAQHVESKAAFVAAVEAKLGELSDENCSMCGVDPPHLKQWSDAWRPELGIVGGAD